VACGDTYLLYDEDDYEGKPHLHIVITEPDDDGRVVLVSVTTRRAKSDTMVCLDAGEHEFITHPSVVTYAYSKILTVAKLEELCVSGDAISKGKATEQLVKRAQNGMLETDRAPHDTKRLFKHLYKR
jgi:hypothetical protein